MSDTARRSQAFRPENDGTVAVSVGEADVNITSSLPHYAEYLYINNSAETSLLLNFGGECNEATSMRIPADGQIFIAYPFGQDLHMMRPDGPSIAENVYITLGDFY